MSSCDPLGVEATPPPGVQSPPSAIRSALPAVDENSTILQLMPQTLPLNPVQMVRLERSHQRSHEAALTAIQGLCEVRSSLHEVCLNDFAAEKEFQQLIIKRTVMP